VIVVDVVAALLGVLVLVFCVYALIAPGRF